MDFRYCCNWRVVVVGGLLGITGALLVAIAMIAYRIHPVLIVPALLLDVVLFLLIRRRWTIPVLGTRTPYCLESGRPVDRATYFVRAVLGAAIGIPIGFAFATYVARCRSDTAFVIVWAVTAVGITVAVTYFGDRILTR